MLRFSLTHAPQTHYEMQINRDFTLGPHRGPRQRPGTRMTINEDAAQESERRLVDSYLRLGEISHLALQRDTITKHY